jgi:hypothetical protein
MFDETLAKGTSNGEMTYQILKRTADRVS